MPEDKLTYLGAHIRAARKRCGLTQQELADQAGLSVKTVQDIEKGRKNATYETLAQLIDRLGIPANVLFPSTISVPEEELQYLISKLQTCTPDNQRLLLNTLDFLTEQLLFLQRKSELMHRWTDHL